MRNYGGVNQKQSIFVFIVEKAEAGELGVEKTT
jgi:hypothetical protein